MTIQRENIRTLLVNSELFNGLKPEEMDSILTLCRETSFKEGQIVFEEGSEGTSLFVMPEGRVSVELRLSGNSMSERIYQATDNEVFGELALVDGHHRSATVRALDNLSLLILERDEFLSLMEKQSRIGYVVMHNLSKILARKVRDTNLSLRNSLLQQKALFGEAI